MPRETPTNYYRLHPLDVASKHIVPSLMNKICM